MKIGSVNISSLQKIQARLNTSRASAQPGRTVDVSGTVGDRTQQQLRMESLVRQQQCGPRPS